MIFQIPTKAIQKPYSKFAFKLSLQTFQKILFHFYKLHTKFQHFWISLAPTFSSHSFHLNTNHFEFKYFSIIGTNFVGLVIFQ